MATSLSPQQEALYRSWMQQIGQTRDAGQNVDDGFNGGDYDYRGYFQKYGPSKKAKGEHFTDEFKLPNHETFSDESMYAVGADRAKAGHWYGDNYTPGKGIESMYPVNNYSSPDQLSAQQMQPDLSLLGNRAPERGPGFGARLGMAGKQLLGNQDLALALLANSGYSPQKRSFGEIFGNSMLQANQMKQGREDDAFKRQMQMMQLANMKRQQSPYGAIQPDKFTPESLAQFEKTQQYSDLKLRPIGMQTGRYNPGDFTPESWASFLNTNDPAQLVRYVTPQNATVEQMAGGLSVVQADKTGRTGPRITPLTSAQQEQSAAATLASEKARGAAEGEAAGGQAAKAPAQASFNTAIGNMRRSIANTPQGMFAGPIGSVTNYGDKKLFNSRVQQLSTELRTVFRIAGEGTLSDQEQKQYGFQLPSADNPPEINEQIIQDLERRVADRQNTQIGNAPASSAAPEVKRRKFNPATGKIE